MVTGLEALSSEYLTALDQHYFATTCGQSFALVGAGDVIAQRIEQHIEARRRTSPAMSRAAVNWARTMRFGVLGVLVSGLGTAYWLQCLEDWVGPTEGLAQWGLVAEKAAMDFCLWAPVANGFYVIAVPVMEGEVPLTAPHMSTLLTQRFAPAMAAEFALFVPYDVLSFSLIPPLVRPLTASCVSLCYAVFMSWWSHRDCSESPSHQADSPMEAR